MDGGDLEQRRLKSDESMDFDKFIDSLFTVLKMTWGAEWGTFTMNKPQLSDINQISMPYIVYSTVSIVPGMQGTVRELRPRLRERIHKEPEEGSTVEPGYFEVYGRVFDTTVEFIIYAENNRKANLLAKRFREVIETYTGLFKQKGLLGINFVSENDRNQRENSEENLASRSIRYTLRTEELLIRDTSAVQGVEISLSAQLSTFEQEGVLPSQTT